MPKTKNFNILHDQVIARPGAEQRLAALQQELLAEIALYELRRSQEMSYGAGDRPPHTTT